MKERLDYISNLRFPLIVGVVFDHASVVMPAILRGGENLPSLLFCMLQTVLKISVPVFFIISGFLFFKGVESFGRELYVRKLRSRIHTLFVPYVLWTLIVLLYSIAKQLPAMVHSHNFDEVNHLLSWQIFWMYKDALPLHFPLWYVRDLILLSLFSPAIWFFFKRLKHAAMLVVFCSFMMHDIDYHISFPISIFYFSLGAYFSICSIDIHKITMKLSWGILPIAAIAIVCSVLGNITLTRFSLIVYALCCVGLSCFFTGKYQYTVPQLLTDSVFFIYASHTIAVVYVLNKLMYSVIPNDALPILLFVRLFIVGTLLTIICFVLYLILKRFLPKTVSVLTGSR